MCIRDRDQTKVPEGMVFDLWSTGKFELPLDQDYKAEPITFTMTGDVDVAAQYRSADIEDGSEDVYKRQSRLAVPLARTSTWSVLTH